MHHETSERVRKTSMGWRDAYEREAKERRRMLPRRERYSWRWLHVAVALIGALVLRLPSTMMDHARAGDAINWPPVDPKQYVTKVDFTEGWAKRLDGFQTLQDLQHAAGTNGTISEWALDDPKPHVSYHWRSQPKNGRVGYMLASVYKDGGIGVGIVTDERIEIIVNNFGAFMCIRCSPPIKREGAEPSWSK